MSQIFYTDENQSFDTELLRQELVTGLGEGNWYINTYGANTVEFVGEGDPSTIIQTHFDNGLTRFKNAAKILIDETAGKVRSKYLTIAPGQEATYISKEADCRAYKAANYPADTTAYPWVQAEADATGLSTQEATDAILLQADQWKQIGSLIEKIRRGGKITVDKKIKLNTAQDALNATLSQLGAL